MASLDKNDATNILDEDAPGQPISVPDSGDTGESGKLKMIVQLVKKCLGVKDIAAMCVQPTVSTLLSMADALSVSGVFLFPHRS